MELDRLTIEDFSPRVGETFAVDAGDGRSIELVLVEAKTYDADVGAPPEDNRSPFNLKFRGPLEPVLAQQICPLDNETLGRLEIFIVPLGHDESGTDYEAVFN